MLSVLLDCGLEVLVLLLKDSVVVVGLNFWLHLNQDCGMVWVLVKVGVLGNIYFILIIAFVIFCGGFCVVLMFWGGFVIGMKWTNGRVWV